MSNFPTLTSGGEGYGWTWNASAGNSPYLSGLNLTLPANRSNGNGLLLIYSVGFISAGHEGSIDLDEFTLIEQYRDYYGATPSQNWRGLAYLVVDGGESSTLNFVIDSESSYGINLCILQFDVDTFEPWDKTLPEAEFWSDPVGTDSTPASPALSPSWGTQDTKWILSIGLGNDTVSTWPTGYTEIKQQTPWTFGTAVCHKDERTATAPLSSEDWHTTPTPNNLTTTTFAVAPILKKGGGFGAFGL